MSNSDRWVVLLPSGRGIKFRHLTPREKDNATERAALQTDKDTPAVTFVNLQLRESVACMVCAVTEEKLLDDKGHLAHDRILAPETKWRDVSAQDLESEGDYAYDNLFSAKDDAVLCAIYKREHEVTEGELTAIMGKAARASEG